MSLKSIKAGSVLDFKQRKMLRVIEKNLNDEDMLNIFEIARFALENDEICHYVADKMDMSDEVVEDTLKKIETIMNK